MLSQNTVVAAVREVLESTYTGTCDIVERQKVTKENKSTGFEEITVLEKQPCKLSFSTIKSSAPGEAAASIVQITKLFIAPEIDVRPGSKLTVTQNGTTAEYTRSGKAAVYNTHQEIVLELFQGWA